MYYYWIIKLINEFLVFKVVKIFFLPISLFALYIYVITKQQPHFHIVKLVYILFLLKNIDWEYSLELPPWGSSNKYSQSMFWAEICQNFEQ